MTSLPQDSHSLEMTFIQCQSWVPLVFYFTNIEEVIYIFRSLGRNAQEKTDEEYGIMSKPQVTESVILSPEAAPSLCAMA